MKLSEIKELLHAEVLYGENFLDIDIDNACGTELISSILEDTKTKAVLLTGLTHFQVIQTASLTGFAAIVFVRGKLPSEEVVDMAKSEKIPILSTKLPLFETCGILFSAGLRGKSQSRFQGGMPRGHNDLEPAKTIKLSYEITGNDFNNAGKATEQARRILKQLGIDSSVIRRVSIAAYEAEMNVVIHARKGNLYFNINPFFIEIIAKDDGPGIPDIDKALEEGFSTASERIRELGFGAGMGLPNMKKFTDNLEIDSTVGKGTKVMMKVNIQPNEKAGEI
ncbi:MAG: anti-sigma regulatory factor [Thermoanaerobacterales bacterium]|nr:anti-sigma regulatory factor [Thermoanaerobacterales bacterium]